MHLSSKDGRSVLNLRSWTSQSSSTYFSKAMGRLVVNGTRLSEFALFSIEIRPFHGVSRLKVQKFSLGLGFA